jgi:hypothetical protein
MQKLNGAIKPLPGKGKTLLEKLSSAGIAFRKNSGPSAYSGNGIPFRMEDKLHRIK